MNQDNPFDLQEEHPTTLYRFYSLNNDDKTNESKFEALKKGKMWMATPDALNDPFEIANLYIDYSKGYPTELCDYFSAALRRSREDIRIASLSKNDFSSLLMWAYYANNHHGFCVEFEVQQQNAIREVLYLSKRCALINSFIRYFGHEMSQEERSQFEFVLSTLSRTKGKEWENENEFRVILPAERVEHVSDAGGTVSLSSVGLKPTRIIMGMKCSNDHRQRIIDIGNLINCPVVSATLSKDEYKMVVE